MPLLDRLFSRKSGPGPETQADPAPPEHRWADRTGTYKIATLVYPSGYTRKGVVIDMSASGARVRFSQRASLPETVTLKIEGVPGARQAQIVWQEAMDAGLRFRG